MLKSQTLHVEIGKLRTEITILGGYSIQEIEGMLGGLTKITDVEKSLMKIYLATKVKIKKDNLSPYDVKRQEWNILN